MSTRDEPRTELDPEAVGWAVVWTLLVLLGLASALTR